MFWVCKDGLLEPCLSSEHELRRILTKVADNAEVLTGNLSQIVQKVNSGKGNFARLLNNDKIAKDLEGTVRQSQTTMKGVHGATATLNEDLQAARHNFLLRGFFKKKDKAKKAKTRFDQKGAG